MLKQQLQIKLSQKLSPQQIQLMKMIQLSTLELEQKIEAEIGENPALETGKQELSKDLAELDNRNQSSETSEIDIDQYVSDAETPSYKLYTNNYGNKEKIIQSFFWWNKFPSVFISTNWKSNST